MLTTTQLHRVVAEYHSILQRAGQEGWLAPLIEAHARTCSVQEARLLLDRTPGIPADLNLRLVPRIRGYARFNKKHKRYGMTLPQTPGTKAGQLRIGLVLHEAAHIWDYQLHGKFGHGPTFCHELRTILEHFEWRKILPMTSSFREIYDRHRGSYCLILTRETTNAKGKVTQAGDRLDGPFSAEEAHEEARVLVNSPTDNVVNVHVYSNGEGQYIGAIYKRGETYLPWSREEPREGRMELPRERASAALLPRGAELVSTVDAAEHGSVSAGSVPDDGPVRNVPEKKPAKPRAAKLPGDRFPVVRGRALALDEGNAERWPKSEATQVVRAWFADGDRRATSAEVVAALGEQLKALKVEHPGSLISRLKQAGFLKVVE